MPNRFVKESIKIVLFHDGRLVLLGFFVGNINRIMAYLYSPIDWEKRGISIG